MRAFEIHTFTGGKWKIDSVFDDREIAIFEARRMGDSNRYTGVRVVEETFDEETQQSLARTIFRGGRVDVEVSRAPSPPPRPMHAGQRLGGGRGGRRAAAKRAARRPKSNASLIIMLTVIVVGGIVALAALQFLPRFL